MNSGNIYKNMAQLQLIFNRIQETKKEQKEIKAMIRDAFTNSKSYQSILIEIKELSEKKKKIEEAINDDFRAEIAKLDIIKSDLDNDNMLLSDAAITQLMKGKTVEVIDKNKRRYDPIFSVRFK